MHHSSLPFLIEVTFNLTAVDESACQAIDGAWKNNILQLILSAGLWSPSLFSRLSFHPFFTSIVGGTAEEPATLKTIEPPSQGTSGIVRGRDLPFPAAPIYRRRTLQANPRNVDSSILFQRRYSAVSLPAVSSPPVTKSDALSSRGRTMQCTRPSLSRSDSRTLTLPETSEENLSHRRMSRNTLLRIPPFPLPHRLLQRPASESSARKVGSVRPISRRMTSIPPPLVLDSIFSYLDEEDEESPVLGREEARRLQQLRTRSTSRAQVL